MKNILFVCTGNTCRSPLAETFLLAKAGSSLSVRSAGIVASVGSDASFGAKEAMAHFGVTKEHVAQQVDEELLAWADIVLTMTVSHKQFITQSFPEVSEKVFTLKQYVNDDDSDTDVSDPFGQPVDIYLETATEIKQLVERLIEKLASK